MSSIELEVAGEELRVGHFTVREAMNAAFRIHAVGKGPHDADIRKSAGRRAKFTLRSNRGTRSWFGVVSSISQTDHDGGSARYSVWVAPKLWLLSHRVHYKVHKHKSVPEIVESLLKPFAIDPVLKLHDEYPKLEYRVQYGESDYDFMRRLLVEAGISFYFRFGEEETKLVLADAPNLNQPRGNPVRFLKNPDMRGDDDNVHSISMDEKVHAHKATFHDHDFRRPHHKLNGHHAHPHAHDDALEEHHYEPGHSLALAADAGGSPVADADGAYRHRDDLAEKRAKRHVQALQAASSKIGFATSLHDLAPGRVFEISGHPHKRLGVGKKLLVTESWISGSREGEWDSGGHAVRTNRHYRPTMTREAGEALNCSDGGNPFEPVNKLTKPRIHGIQSGIVVGPEGQQVHADEHGRIRVHFPWDRDEKKGTSSCWVRVAQAGAGGATGLYALPRVGDEVLVSFLNGDPDHPVVVGGMSNPTSPTPYSHVEHGTRSTWRTGDGNEITLDDHTDRDIFYMQAAKDLHKVVRNDELEHTLGDRHITVDGDLILRAKGRIVLKAGDDIVVRGHPTVNLNPTEKPPSPKKPKELRSGRRHDSPKSDATKANAELKKMDAPNTAKATSNAKAQKRLAQKYMPLAIKLGKKYDLPPALILAWMSRESGLGLYLRPDGYSKFDGYGYGLLQVDRRYHKPTGDPFGAPSCEQAIGDVFAGMLRGVKQRHPGWTREEQIVGALVDYNSGPGNAQTRPNSQAGWAAMDGGTADDDYSRDVWARAEWFAKHLDWPAPRKKPRANEAHAADADDRAGLVLANDQPVAHGN
ncbi:MAG: type VI secretion system tip protein VgrG [Polyangiaceae bacterium]|nr:type VI secretion system tip protein VgrG [Polyangiaceae bacterium]